MQQVKKTKMCVLHLIPGFGGGISSLVVNLIRGSNDKIIKQDVCSFNECNETIRDEIERHGGHVYVLTRLSKNPIFGTANEFAKIIKENGPYDLVHLHETDIVALFFAILCYSHGVKRVASHAHITQNAQSGHRLFDIGMYVKRFITRHCVTDLCSCSKMASRYIFGNKSVLAHKVMHIPNGVPENQYFERTPFNEIENLKQEFELPCGTLVIGHVGYFGYQKNHEFMINLIHEMRKRHISFVWLFVGEGAGFDDAVKQVHENGDDSVVRFVGRRTDVQKLYELFDVFVLPSHFEGLPTVAVEAQAKGCPAILADAISSECDFKLGMTKWLSLDQPADTWIQAIQEMSHCCVPSEAERKT
ncbi:MAG: glycosyltransferase [Ruthenibacterium sp.]